MPTIEVNKRDINLLLLKEFSNEEFEEILQSAKAELKEIIEDNYKIELNDTNRPDLWTSAGLARQINQYLKLKKYNYPFFHNNKTDYKIIVDKNIEKIRPYVIAFIAKNIKISELLLVELIQNQEKFAENFGNKRKDIAIGIYKFDRIKFPVYYKAARPDEIEFIPLGFDEKMNLNEILEKHPKGIEYAHLVKSFNFYPILLDSSNNVLSFPPIINSKYIGEVEVNDTNIFIELTGYNIKNLILIANVFAVDLFDRGAEIVPVKIKYPYETDEGKEIVVPSFLNKSIEFNISYFERLFGEIPDKINIIENLEKMGYSNINLVNNKVMVDIPPYRNDILHPVDVVEDYIIGKGFNNIKLEMPTEYFTIGALDEIEIFMDEIRNIIIGAGFNEIISNILTSAENIYDKMNITEKNGVEIANPMTESYNALRNSIIPSLLEVEAYSAKADYPHKIFEIGEIAIKETNENYGSKTLISLGVLSAHPKSNFSEMRSYLNNIMYYIGIDDFEIKEEEKEFLISGRSAAIYVFNNKIGYIGEIHPEVLENWNINMPVTIMEFNIAWITDEEVATLRTKYSGGING